MFVTNNYSDFLIPKVDNVSVQKSISLVAKVQSRELNKRWDGS